MALVEARSVNPAGQRDAARILWLRKGHSVTELTLSAESVGRQLQPVPMPRRGGAFNKTGGSAQSPGGCRSPRKLPAALQQRVRYCICLSLCLGGLVPISQSAPAKPGLSLATLSPNSFFGPFRSCCRLTHIEGVPRPRTVVFLTCVV